MARPDGRNQMQFDQWGIAVQQLPVNGYELSYNPDDGRFYLHYRSEYGDLETMATFAGDKKGFWNARFYAKHIADVTKRRQHFGRNN